MIRRLTRSFSYTLRGKIGSGSMYTPIDPVVFNTKGDCLLYK
jgi:hypothetical protein